jgi:hypothetical protein
MTTITLKYNESNPIASKTIELIMSLGVFEMKKSKKDGIEKALEDVEKGRIKLIHTPKNRDMA